MSELPSEQRTGGDRRMDPCIHERDWTRIENAVSAQDKRISALENNHTETRVYMKQVLDSQEDIKNSIRDIQKKMDERPVSQPGQQTPVLVEQVADKKYNEQTTLQKMLPQVMDIVKWLVIIIAALVGYKIANPTP